MATSDPAVHHAHHAISPPLDKIKFNSILDQDGLYDDEKQVEEFEDARESFFYDNPEEYDEPSTDLTSSPIAEPEPIEIDLSKLKIVHREYPESQLDQDLERCRKALELLLNSRITEAVNLVQVNLDSSLYCSLGYSLFLFLQSLLSFEPQDISRALDNLKITVAISSRLRKQGSYVERLGKAVRGSGTVTAVKGMTRVQRHAEVVYGESLMLKAVLEVVYGSDIMAVIKEALNLRSAYAIFKTLAKFMDENPNDPTIDKDFKSGVQLGSGLISLVLSLLPNKVLRIIEIIGYSGDRKYALNQCAAAGGWSTDEDKIEPAINSKDEGLRRIICDMVLMSYHLVISTFIPLTDVNVKFAEKLSAWSLQRFPTGVFFLFFSGRLNAAQGLLSRSIAQHKKAISCQKDWKQLQHICWWELGLIYLVTNQSKSHEAFVFLSEESMWSKCVYNYARAVTLYESKHGDPKSLAEVMEIMKNLPGMMQRIAGKSIPLEKFMARKAKKFLAQNNRLCIPGLEMAYIFNCFEIVSRSICRNILSNLDVELVILEKFFNNPEEYGNPNGTSAQRSAEFWEDFCLVHLIRGVILSKLALPNQEHLPENMDDPKLATIKMTYHIPRPSLPDDYDELINESKRSFKLLFDAGPQIKFDHWYVWFGHYELGRLHKSLGDIKSARMEFEKVMSGKQMEISGQKGKCSLNNLLDLRTHSALIAMDISDKVSITN